MAIIQIESHLDTNIIAKFIGSLSIAEKIRRQHVAIINLTQLPLYAILSKGLIHS
jgi:hypothetical protein